MKIKLFITVICLSFFGSSLAQTISEEKILTSQELYDYHFSKRKVNNTVGWITLVGGVGMVIGGIAINLSVNVFNTVDNSEGLWLVYLGGAATLVSIPLFISANSHKKKMKIQLQNGAVGNLSSDNYTGLSISFSF